MAETKVPAIKNIPANTDPETKLALESIKEALEVRLGRRGDPKDRAVTLRELIDSGLATDLAKAPYNPNIAGATGFGPATDEVGDVEVPPSPTSLTAAGLFTDALLSWNQSTNAPSYGNHSLTEIWRSQNEDLKGSVLVGTTNAFIYTDKGLEYDSTYYYWVRFVSTTDTPGPWSNMASATTIENIAATMIALSETLSGLPGYNLLQTGATAATIIKSSSQPSTRANGDALQLNDIWFDTDDSQIYTRNAANNAWVAARDAALVTLYSSLSSTVTTQGTSLATAQSNIVTLTSANSARVSEITELEAITNGYSNSSTIAAAITSEATVRASADSANATSITNLSASVGSGNDSGGTAYSASNTIISHVNATDANAAAAYVLKVEANGAVAGMVLEANASDSGTGSAIHFQAEKFAIWDGSGDALSSANHVAPFIVDSGVVYIDTARIKNGAIVNAHIETLHGGKIIADTITATQIDGDTITAAEINATGFLDALVAKIGTLTADHITSSTITANDLLNVDTLNVKYFANATPQIYAQTGSAYPLVRRGFYYTPTAVTGLTGVHTCGNTTVTNVRNGGSWTVWLYGVFGDVANVNVQYSFDNSTWVDSPNGPTFTWNAGTYRPYTYVYYDNQITGLSSSQHTIYFRVHMNGKHNYTSLGLFILLDNMASTP